MTYFVVKAVHLIGMVSWFAGLFYIPRIFIYSVEARARPEPEREVLLGQLTLMGRRLWYGITWPAMLVTLGFGTWLVILYGEWMQPWVHLKLTLVASLVGYHLGCGHLRKTVAAGTSSWTSTGLRLWNEVATIILVATVLTASLKAAVFRWSVLIGVVATVGGLALGVFLYKLVRRRAEARGGLIPASPAASTSRSGSGSR